jgi:hypothetical protein
MSPVRAYDERSVVARSGVGSGWEGFLSLSGCLIAESLRVGGTVDGIRLRVTKVSRADVGDVGAGQPRTWTFIEFELADDDAEQFAHGLAGALQPLGGWYCDFRSAAETFVVFADRIFRYPRGDQTERAGVADYARSVGVPDAQLDWPE